MLEFTGIDEITPSKLILSTSKNRLANTPLPFVMRPYRPVVYLTTAQVHTIGHLLSRQGQLITADIYSIFTSRRVVLYHVLSYLKHASALNMSLSWIDSAKLQTKGLSNYHRAEYPNEVKVSDR